MISRYLLITIVIILIAVGSIVTVLIATPLSIEFIGSGPGRVVHVYYAPLDFCRSSRMSDLIVVGVVRSVEELYDYVDGELRFYYNVSVDVVESLKQNLKHRSAQSSKKEVVSFIVPGRGTYHVVIELHTLLPVRAYVWVKSNGFTSWVEKVVSFPPYGRLEQLSPDKVVVEEGLKRVGECKSFTTYSGASGRVCVLRSIESSWKDEFPIKRKVVLFLTENKASGNLHLDMKLDVVDNKAILTHGAYIHPIEEENTFDYKDIMEKIKSCSTGS